MDQENVNLGPSMSTCKVLPFFVKRSGKEVCHRLCYYIISLASCFLAIFVALIANTVISQAPLMFLKISEIAQGEVDMVFTPSLEGPKYFNRYFNMTKMDLLTKDKVGLLAPRLIFEGTTLSKNDRLVDLTLMVLDSDREKQQKIGSKYDPPALREGECSIPSSLAEYLELEKGDYATLTISMDPYLHLLTMIYNETSESFQARNKATVKCKVAATFDDLGGKVPVGTDDGYLWMELHGFLKHLSKEIDADENFKEFLAHLNPYDVVSYALTNHPNREKIYVNSDFQYVQKQMAEHSSAILATLGFFPVVSTMPILKSLVPLSMGAVFLRIILNLVVILLATISAFLIYSLLTISVETRSFELGMLRMLGTNKLGLAFLVIVQAMLFVVPAFVLALVLSFPTLSLVSSLFESTLGFTFIAVPTVSSFLWAIGIGILVPLAASALPIKQALSKNLVESLDMTRSKTQGIHITVEYSQKGTSWGMVAFGAVTIVFGLSIYYFLPLSLLSMNLQLMLWIMLSILLAIIVGLVIISLNIMHPLERILVYLLLFYESACMKFLILKNMVAHKFRNRRTGVIYSLSLGFLLFAVVSYTMELRNSQLTMLSKHGAYLEVQWKLKDINYKDAIAIEQALLTDYSTEVEDFSWTSGSLTSDLKLKLKDNWVADFGRQSTYIVRVQGVSPNYFEISNNYFLHIFAQNDTTALSLGEQLYTTRGSQAMATGSFLEQNLNIDIKDPKSTFLFLCERASTDLAFESRSLFMLSTCPGFRMSRTVRSYQSVLISLPLFLQLSNSTSLSLANWDTLSIKIRDDKQEYYNKVYNGLNQMSLRKKKAFTVWSYSNESNNIDQVKYFLDVMFIVIIIFFMFLSFFSLSSSMTANILEQAKELSIVRSIGLSRVRTVFLHVYEAFTLVLSSSLIGAAIGMLVGYTLSLQRELFTDLPISFNFPYLHLVVMFVTSIICAVLSTVSPSLYLLRKPISEVAKL